MLNMTLSRVRKLFPASEVEAHCDGPCGVYDPASARVAAEAVLSMTKKIRALTPPANNEAQAWAAYLNTMSRYVQIKEEQAHIAKTELLVLWTDYFKPVHLEQFPDLHETFWKAAKLCSACKVGVSLEDATALMETIENIHKMFWATKNRDVAWVVAS
ncbi:superoxide dismutase, Ni [candidate division KSB3 bacterium]|uniref:Superoxide dismutase, Ni n=1 Tax=candidate division KSB3 bacterium TaxID=2044937 RepID=A0A2G6KKI8_9BACT|nr:MAG: superoxide dismutase, Ni [candidate division KSB3 bacterium]